MMAVKIKKGDTVKVIAGKDKDKQGKVLVVEPKKNRVVVEGINMVSKHTKANRQNTNGGIIEKEAPIDVSNVMYLHKGKATRIGYKFVNGKKVRVAKSTGDVLD
ncbi:MAG: 50S ribosomal protein L24 [Eubacterium sp.]|nr:50S ribosomal protein L24 [Eubacterium sp.]